jgi:hypothetical protein
MGNQVYKTTSSSGMYFTNGDNTAEPKPIYNTVSGDDSSYYQDPVAHEAGWWESQTPDPTVYWNPSP